MTPKNPYWRAYFRFALPLMAILGILNYLQSDRTNQMGTYPWLQRLLCGIVISFIIPPFYLGAVEIWRRTKR
jgi:hypothetical protein